MFIFLGPRGCLCSSGFISSHSFASEKQIITRPDIFQEILVGDECPSTGYIRDLAIYEPSLVVL